MIDNDRWNIASTMTPTYDGLFDFVNRFFSILGDGDYYFYRCNILMYETFDVAFKYAHDAETRYITLSVVSTITNEDGEMETRDYNFGFSDWKTMIELSGFDPQHIPLTGGTAEEDVISFLHDYCDL